MLQNHLYKLMYSRIEAYIIVIIDYTQGVANTDSQSSEKCTTFVSFSVDRDHLISS